MLLLNKGLTDQIKDWIKQEYPNGIDIYLDYTDEISAQTAQEIINKDNPREYFYDLLMEWWEDEEYQEKIEIFKQLVKDFCNKGILKNVDEAFYFQYDYWDCFTENIDTNFHEEQYLKQKFACNIIIDSGDWNYDNACNVIYPHYDGGYETSPQEIIKENCLAWLAKKQGYNRTVLFNYLNKNNYRKKHPNKFLQSCFNELLNCTSGNLELVFLVQFTLDELISMKKEAREILISKDTTCGLFDSWNGAGSLLEIQLEKDIHLDPKWIGAIDIDSAAGNCNVIMDVLNGITVPRVSKSYTHCCYSIQNVYGVYDTLWQSKSKINWKSKKAS